MPNYHPDSTDDVLLQGCREQHRLAQRYLYQRYFGRLLGIPMRYCGSRDEAKEVLNTAFCKIFAAVDHFQGSGALGAWMARIVFHTTIDQVRRTVSYRRVHDYQTTADAPIDNPALSELATEELFALIQQLPPATRNVFSLYVVDGYKHREIADLLGIDEGTSKWHLAKARRWLQEQVQAQHNYLQQA
jgi:RNA polymerase sigma-70 factor (ECF subfamily)